MLEPFQLVLMTKHIGENSICSVGNPIILYNVILTCGYECYIQECDQNILSVDFALLFNYICIYIINAYFKFEM